MPALPTLSALVAETRPKLIARLTSHNIAEYVGERIAAEDDESINSATPVEVRVFKQDGTSHLLNPRFDLRNHSPDGFNFGYSGSGPSQLALAILADFTGSGYFAQKFYQDFKHEYIARVQSSRLCIPAKEVFNWIEPKLSPFLADTLGHLFAPDGTPCGFAYLPSVSGGPEFQCRWAENGKLELLDLSDESLNTISSVPIEDIPEFYASTVFGAAAANSSKK